MTERLREVVKVLNQHEALKALLAWMVNVAKLIPRSAGSADAYAWVVITKNSVIEGNRVFNAVFRAVYVYGGRAYEGEVDVYEASAYVFRRGSLAPLDIAGLVRIHGNKIPIAQNQLWLLKVKVLERVGGNAKALEH